MKKPLLNNWEITTLFGEVVITGTTEGNLRVTDRLIWLSDWTVRTESFIWKLGPNEQWDWIKDLLKDKVNYPKYRGAGPITT